LPNTGIRHPIDPNPRSQVRKALVAGLSHGLHLPSSNQQAAQVAYCKGCKASLEREAVAAQE